MSKNWKKSRAEQEMIDYEAKQIAKWKIENKNKYPTRDYNQELKEIGLTDDQCSDVLEWINTLSIQITGNNHTVDIVDGIIKVSNTE